MRLGLQVKELQRFNRLLAGKAARQMIRESREPRNVLEGRIKHGPKRARQLCIAISKPQTKNA